MLMIFPRRGSVQANGVTLRGHETVFAPCIYWQTAVFSVKIQHVGKGQALAGQTTPTRHAVSMQRKIIVSAEHSTPPHRREFLRCGMTGSEVTVDPDHRGHRILNADQYEAGTKWDP